MTEAEQIARYVAEHGVTRCPDAFLGSTQAAAERVGSLGDTGERSGRRWGRGAGANGGGHRNVARLRRARAEIRRVL